ncbi:MAG: hypothetical protein ACYTFY_01595 [Planctomycetota bacterium]|jgi:hypothetical protein
MLELAVLTKEDLINNFGCSRKLAARIGTLLSSDIALTATVVEESAENKQLERLLLSSKLRSITSEQLNDIFTDLSGIEEYRQLCDEFPLKITTQEKWTVIAFDEELKAESGFAEVAADSPSRTSLTPANIYTDANSTDISNPQTTDHAMNNDLPGGLNLNQLRIAVFAGETSAERVSALRKLLFSDFENNLKAEIFIKALSEEDSQLRAASAAALKSIGLSNEVSETLRLLAEGDSEEKKYAARRLSSTVGIKSTDLEKSSSVMSLLGSLRSETDKPALKCAIRSIAEIGHAVSDFSNIIKEVSRLLIEKAVSDLLTLAPDVKYAFKKFESSFPGMVSDYLLEDYLKTEDLEIKSFLMSCAISGKINDEDKEKYLKAAADCLLKIPAESANTHLIGSFLTNSGQDGIRIIIENFDLADNAHKRFLIRILDNSLRFREIPDRFRFQIAEKCSDLLKSGSKYLIHDIFETRLLAPPRLPDSIKLKTADAICTTLRQFSLPQVLNNIENNLVRLGCEILPVLTKFIVEHPTGKITEIACSSIGRISAESVIESEVNIESLKEALRLMQKMSFSKESSSSHIFLTMGRICSNSVITNEIIEIINTNLFNRLKGDTSDSQLIEALGWITKNTNSNPESICRITGIALNHIEQADSETTISSENISGENIFRFSGELEIDSELIPACIDAVGHAVLSPNIESSLQDQSIKRLLKRWSECADFTVQWSPGNVSQLSELLGKIGSSNKVENNMKLEIAHTLARKLSEVPILEALTRIIVSEKNLPEFNHLAASISMRILNTIEKEKDLTHEDREIYIGILGKLAVRGNFETRKGSSIELLSRVIDEIIIGVRDGISGSFSIVKEVRENADLPDAISEALEKHLNKFTQLTQNKV